MSKIRPGRPLMQPAHVLSALVDSCDEGIVVMDLDGVVRSWNRGACTIYGYTTAEMVGRSVLDILPAEAGFASTLAAVAGGTVERQRAQHSRRDGRPVDVLITATPVRDGRGRIVAAAIMVRDLTEATEAAAALQQSEQRWRAIVDSAVDGIIVINAHGRIEAFNPSAERLFGYAKAEVLGENVKMLMPSPYREGHDEYIGNYLKSGTPKVIGIGREVTGLHRDGTEFPLHLSVGEIQGGDQRRFTGIIHDLRPRVRIEERLREQTALARLGEMAAVIAHEVRNPLAGVRGAIQVIGSRLPRDSGDWAMVNEIVSRIDGLNELIKDLLLFSRPPRPRPTRADVVALMAGTVELLRTDPAMAGVTVSVQGSAPPLMVDGELVKTVFLNLLINAAQAMQGKGTIEVSVAAADQVCTITFHDSGPGIPAEIREKIFTPFFTTKARGTGLGLPTARALIEAHGGSLAVECPPLGGTTVTVGFPL